MEIKCACCDAQTSPDEEKSSVLFVQGELRAEWENPVSRNQIRSKKTVWVQNDVPLIRQAGHECE